MGLYDRFLYSESGVPSKTFSPSAVFDEENLLETVGFTVVKVR